MKTDEKAKRRDETRARGKAFATKQDAQHESNRRQRRTQHLKTTHSHTDKRTNVTILPPSTRFSPLNLHLHPESSLKHAYSKHENENESAATAAAAASPAAAGVSSVLVMVAAAAGGAAAAAGAAGSDRRTKYGGVKCFSAEMKESCEEMVGVEEGVDDGPRCCTCILHPLPA